MGGSSGVTKTARHQNFWTPKTTFEKLAQLAWSQPQNPSLQTQAKKAHEQLYDTFNQWQKIHFFENKQDDDLTFPPLKIPKACQLPKESEPVITNDQTPNPTGLGYYVRDPRLNLKMKGATLTLITANGQRGSAKTDSNGFAYFPKDFATTNTTLEVSAIGENVPSQRLSLHPTTSAVIDINFDALALENPHLRVSRSPLGMICIFRCLGKKPIMYVRPIGARSPLIQPLKKSVVTSIGYH